MVVYTLVPAIKEDIGAIREDIGATREDIGRRIVVQVRPG
jgi:hypothetical protein